METLVIDASVAVKWIVKERDREKAVSILRSFLIGELNLWVPDIFFYEVPSALLSSEFYQKDDIEEALRFIRGILIPTVYLDLRLQCEAARLALKLGISFYDASYLALAIQKDADFIIADEKLINKVGGALTFVRSLYDYPYFGEGGQTMAEEKIGKVMDYFAKVGVAGILLEGTLKVGDTVHIKGHTTDMTFTVDSMEIDRAPVPQAGKDQTIGIKVGDRVRPGDTVYLVKP